MYSNITQLDKDIFNKKIKEFVQNTKIKYLLLQFLSRKYLTKKKNLP